MAKKQSTRPNLLGIQKQMLDAGRDTRAESFMKGAMGAFAVNMAETEKQEAMMEKYMEDLGGIENIVKLPMEQRGQVEEFLRTNRDEYSDLAEQYQKSKDPAIKDKMNAIKYKFQTLDSELSKFAASKAEYMHDYEEGNLMKGGSFAKDNSFYMGMYGDPKTQFTIGETGEMSFTVNGETKAFKDVGSHTLRNYEAEKNIDTLFGTAADLKVSGKAFDKNRITNNFVNGHKSISRNDLQAILQTDLTGDGDKPSFMDQWASGGLGDEFYNGVDKNNITEEDVKTLLKDKQRGLDLMGKYVGNISQGIYDDGKLDETIALTRKAKQAQINASNRANRKGSDGGGDGSFTEKVKIDGLPNTYVGPEERNKRRDYITNEDGPQDFSGAYGDYKWDEKEGMYILNGDKENMKTPWEVMQDEKLDKRGDSSADYGANPISIQNASLKQDGTRVAGGLTAKMVVGDDDTVKANLNAILPKNNPNNYYFDEKPDYIFGMDPGYEDPTLNAVVLKDGNGEVVKYEDGTPITIYTDGGGGFENTKNEVQNSIIAFNTWMDNQEDFGLESGQKGQDTEPVDTKEKQ